MASTRVDGGDARAVYCAVAEARRMAVADACPVLIEVGQLHPPAQPGGVAMLVQACSPVLQDMHSA